MDGAVLSLLLLLTNQTPAVPPVDDSPYLDRWLTDTATVGLTNSPFATVGIARPPGRFEP